VPLVANPHVAFGSVVLERATAALAAPGQHVLLVDAADNAPPPHELAPVDLAGCIERLSAEVSYLAARGLPRAFVDTRGSAAALLDVLCDAAPEADVLLVHADARDLARLLRRAGRARPLLLGADHAESLKHAYAGLPSCWRSAAADDLRPAAGGAAVAAARRPSPTAWRAAPTASSGALLQDWAVVDPASDVRRPRRAGAGTACCRRSWHSARRPCPWRRRRAPPARQARPI
jgi:hypothetical protein